MDPSVSLIVTIVLGVITFLALGIGLIFGFKRNGMMTVVRFAFLAVSIAVAALSATAVAVAILKQNTDFILDASAAVFHNEELLVALKEYMASGSAAVEDIRALLIALIAPVIFAVAFAIVNLLLFIVYAIVTACTCSNRHRRNAALKAPGNKSAVKKCNWWTRILVVLSNVLMSFVIAICLIVPATYYVGLVSDVCASVEQIIVEEREQASATLISQQEDSSALDDQMAVIQMFADLKDSPFLNIYSGIGSVVTNPITQVHGQTVHDMILSAVPVIHDLSVEAANLDLEALNQGTLTEESVDELALFVSHAADGLRQIVILDNLTGEILCDAAECWKDGQPFLTVDIYQILGEQDTAEEATLQLEPVIKVLCEVIADREKPLASDKLQLVSDIIGPAGGIVPVIDALSNLTESGIQDVDRQAIEKLFVVADEYKTKDYADRTFGKIIFAVLDSSSLGLPEDARQVLDAVVDSFAEDERTASGLLSLFGETLTVAVDVTQELSSSSETISSFSEVLLSAAEILEQSPRVDTLLASLILDSYDVLPLPEEYSDAVATFMTAVKEQQQLYSTGSSVIKLLGKSLDVMDDFAQADVGNLDADSFFAVRDVLCKSGNEEVNRVTTVLMDEAIAVWMQGESYCGITDPLGTYPEVSQTLYPALLYLVTASDKAGFIGDIFETITDLSEIDFANASASTFYDLANKVSPKPFVDLTAGTLISDAAKAWKQGDTFCGIADPVGDCVFASGIYEALIHQPGENVLASDKFIAAGNAVSLANLVLGTQVLPGDNPDLSPESTSTVEQVKNLVETINKQSANIVKNALTEEVVSQLITGTDNNVKDDGQSAAAVSGAIGVLVDGLLNLKTDETLTPEEVEREQQAVSGLLDAINTADEMNEDKATELVDTIKDSSIVSDAVASLIVEDASGNKSSVIQPNVDQETQVRIENALNEAEMDDTLRQNILLIFGISGNRT